MTDTLDAVASTATGTDAPLVVVTSDSHVAPMLDQLRPYCPPSHRTEFDEFAARSDEMDRIRDEIFRTDELAEARERMFWNLGTDGHVNMASRIRDLDRDGVAGEVIFHGSPGGGQIPFMMPGIGVVWDNTDLYAVGQRIYNDWLADFIASSPEPERHIGLAHLPMWDVEAAIVEVRRARESGLRAVNFPASRNEIKPYEDPAWDPFWAACVELDMPLVNHGAGGATTPPVSGPTGLFAYIAESVAVGKLSPVCRLVFGGAFEKHPGLRLVQTEQPGWWYDQVLRELDSIWLTWRQEMGDVVKRAPSEYCRESYFVGASFQSRFEAEGAIETGFVANMLWGSDYPHPEGTYRFDPEDGTPMTHIAMRHTYSGLPGEPVRAMLGENAIGVYGFDRDKLSQVAAQINAPTLDMLAEPVEEKPAHFGLAFRTFAGYH